MTIEPYHTLSAEPPSNLTAIPASHYSFDVLANIYNQTRIDYIVPMPMNAKRMREYVHQYDIDLNASIVSLNSNQEITGICMVAFRDNRAWITRLGVIPEKRLHKNGQFLMQKCLDEAAAHGVNVAQLEVIKGNAPARQLFLKLGFQDRQELLVIRRPPGKPSDVVTAPATFTEIPADEIPGYLVQRKQHLTWIEENASLLNATSLKGIRADLPSDGSGGSGKSGWLIYEKTLLQITHLALNPHTDAEMSLTLLNYLHATNPIQDTKIENVPADSPLWQTYQQMGYLEVFRRTEMHRSIR